MVMPIGRGCEMGDNQPSMEYGVYSAYSARNLEARLAEMYDFLDDILEHSS